MNQNNTICKICNEQCNKMRALHLHVKRKHNMSSKDYYDKFYKKDDEGICLTCGKTTDFLHYNRGYNKYCCDKCKRDKNFGIYSKINYKKATEKCKQTTYNKYGVESVLQLPEIRDKSFTETAKKKRLAHSKETFINNYGVDTPFKVHNIKKKIARTKEHNNHRSKLEIYFESILIENNIKFESNYSDERYPYSCDFYIFEYDMFIEIHNYWHHGTHFYDSNNTDDINILNHWKEKAKTIPQYQQAIQKWTVIDLEKLTCANIHHLNYIVLWNKDDIDLFISNYIKI